VVATRKGFPYPSHVRAGLVFTASPTNVSLTAEQVKLIEADTELTFVDAEAVKKAAKDADAANKASLEEAKTNPSGNHENARLGDNSGQPVPL